MNRLYPDIAANEWPTRQPFIQIEFISENLREFQALLKEKKFMSLKPIGKINVFKPRWEKITFFKGLQIYSK